MENRPSSLGDKFACLRDTAQARKETCAWIPDAIHALIIAALVRIFTRLEQIFALWQAGQLPPPAIRSLRASTARRGTTPRATRSNRATRAPKVPPRLRVQRNRPQPTAPTSATPAAPPGLRPRQGRAPPAGYPSKNTLAATA